MAEARHVVNSILNQVAGRLFAGAAIHDVVSIVDEAERGFEDVELYALIAGDANRDAEAAIKVERRPADLNAVAAGCAFVATARFGGGSSCGRA